MKFALFSLGSHLYFNIFLHTLTLRETILKHCCIFQSKEKYLWGANTQKHLGRKYQRAKM